MFALIKRLICDIRFQIRELKIQSKEADEIDRIEEEHWNHPMIGFSLYKDMQRRHDERVRQHQIERAAIV